MANLRVPGWISGFALTFLFVTSVIAGPVTAPAQDTAARPQEPDGFRNGNYRSPTPQTLAGARVLTNRAAQELWETGTAVFIDVLPRFERPPKLPKETIFRVPKRNNIPGSIWLPNVGAGVVRPGIDVYFRINLRALSGGDKKKPLVFYCLADCWMSWNAARRALIYGYGNIYWYPDGTDGWTRHGGALELSSPVPLNGG